MLPQTYEAVPTASHIYYWQWGQFGNPNPTWKAAEGADGRGADWLGAKPLAALLFTKVSLQLQLHLGWECVRYKLAALLTKAKSFFEIEICKRCSKNHKCKMWLPCFTVAFLLLKLLFWKWVHLLVWAMLELYWDSSSLSNQMRLRWNRNVWHLAFTTASWRSVSMNINITLTCIAWASTYHSCNTGCILFRTNPIIENAF